MKENACCEILKLLIDLLRRQLGVYPEDMEWNRIQNLINEIGPSDSSESTMTLVARRHDAVQSQLPIDEPPPPF